MGDLWQEHNKILTRDDGCPIGYSTLSQWFAKWLKKEGLPHLQFHGLRHTNGTLMIAGDIDIAAVSEHLGHANVAITGSTYAHTIRRKRKEGVAKTAEWLNKALEGNI